MGRRRGRSPSMVLLRPECSLEGSEAGRVGSGGGGCGFGSICLGEKMLANVFFNDFSSIRIWVQEAQEGMTIGMMERLRCIGQGVPVCTTFADNRFF